MTTTRHLLATTANTLGDPADLRVALSWDSRHPHEVVMDCHATSGVVRWVFAWELLAEGVHTPAGIGNIHIRPAAPGSTEIVLRSPTARAVLHVPSGELIAFLAETWLVEPRPVTDAEIAAQIEQWVKDGVS